MKKFISVLLVLTLVLGMGIFTFLTDDHDIEGNGFDFDVPARLQQVEFDSNLIAAGGLTEEELTNIWASFRYDEALPEDVRNNILDARVVLAFRENWSASAVFIIGNNTLEVTPYWASIFPYWDYQQIQDHKISIEQTTNT